MTAGTDQVVAPIADVRVWPEPVAGHTPWSARRLSAAIAATRHRSHGSRRALHDEIEFFTAHGAERRVASGTSIVHSGRRVGEVHLIRDGAFAVMNRMGDRWPILDIAVPDEICCPLSLFLGEPAPWEAVAVVDSSVVSMPADRFCAAVRDRWTDRWSTRTLNMLAEIGARVADLDARDLAGQAAALLLRLHGETSVVLCRETMCDLLDVDPGTATRVIAEFERLGAVELTGDRIRVSDAKVLHSTVSAARSASR